MGTFFRDFLLKLSALQMIFSELNLLAGWDKHLVSSLKVSLPLVSSRHQVSLLACHFFRPLCVEGNTLTTSY